jgi:cytochrome c
MKKMMALICLVLLSWCPGSAAFSADKATPEEAKALVEKGVLYTQNNGKEKALKEFSNPKGEFVKGELYIVVTGLDGTVLAHPTTPKLVGVNTIDIPDVDGKLFRKEFVEAAKTKGSGWVDYKFKNPVTNKVEAKISYFKKAGDMILIAGTYK